MPSNQQKPELEPTKVPSDIDVAWSAGIFEGEGHARQQRYSTATLHVVQKDPEILFRLRDWFGGKIRFASSVNVPFENQCHVWDLHGDKARIFLFRIHPFLSARRKAQIGCTKTFDFLGGLSPESVDLDVAIEMLGAFNESKLSTVPRNVARRKRMKQESWYVKRRQMSKRGETAPERLM